MTYARYIGHILDDYLRRLVSEDSFHTYEVGEYYPHMLGLCPRKGYYDYVYGPRLSDRGVRYVNLGITLHDFILRGFAERGYRIEVPFEFRVNDEVRIRGRIDGVSIDHVLELKTTSRLPKEPYPHHVAQVSLYMRALDRQRAYILYVSRNDLSRRVFEVPFDEAAFDRAVSTALRIHDALVKGSPPDPDPVADWECRDCPYKKHCPVGQKLLKLRKK